MEFAQDLFIFLWAVLNNWAGYVTGGVVVALAWFWSTLQQQPISRKVGIALACFFLILAIFNAWRDQFTRANMAEANLENDHAHFMPTSLGIQRVDVDKSVPAPQAPLLYEIRILMHNDAPHTALGIKGRLIVTTQTLTEPPSINTIIDDGPNEAKDFQLEVPVNVEQDVPPCFIAYELRYDDSVTGKSYRQAWYFRWNGSKNGVFGSSFANVPSFDINKLVGYLKHLNVGWGD